MPPFDTRNLPFLSRDMLAFRHGLSLKLRVITQSRLSSALTIRGMTKEGVFTLKHIPTNDSLIKIEDFIISDFPIFVSVTDEANFYVQGAVFATIQLVANDDVICQLASGMVYGQKSLSYPAGNSIDQRPGGGLLTQVSVTTPGVGANWSSTVPNGQIWKIKSLGFTFVTSATVANRRPQISFTKSSTSIYCFNDIDQTASLTGYYSLNATSSMPDRLDNSVYLIGMPPEILLTAGDIIQSETTNLQVGDQMSFIRIQLEQYFDSTP